MSRSYVSGTVCDDGARKVNNRILFLKELHLVKDAGMVIYSYSTMWYMCVHRTGSFHPTGKYGRIRDGLLKR